jgi:hypothetical protein
MTTTNFATEETPIPPKQENVWINIALNVLIPSVLMSNGKSWFGLEPAPLLVISLAFPVCYGIYDFVTRRKYNFFSVIGFVSILISGGVGLMELDKGWIAVKEAAIPLLFAIAILVSLKTPFPLVRTFLFSPGIFNVPKVEAALVEKNTKPQFERLLVKCTLLLAGSMLLSAVLSFFLAKYLIRSETGTDAFVEEMGRMTAWSWPAITLPSMAIMMVALYLLANGIESLTGYELDDVLLVGAPREKKQEEASEAGETDARSETTPDAVEE